MTMVNVLNDFCGFHAYPTVISCIIWASDLVGVMQGCHLNPPLFHFHSSVHSFSSVCIPVFVTPVNVTINNGTSVRHSVVFREFLSQKTRYLNVICSNPSPYISLIEGTKDLDFRVADASVLPAATRIGEGTSLDKERRVFRNMSSAGLIKVRYLHFNCGIGWVRSMQQIMPCLCFILQL